ncbi:9301_t:CDS:1 [Diversispora eburnea]|uniref:9301_t:CDS:1 n=1 Tax=Diversispora eburnea TaxID=1213867 RepID=A0A9N9A1R1_9GLOM|nr:9301_t:CDS:1 [Diversispora eburnea]
MVLYEIATGGKMPFEEIESDDIFKRSICEDKRPDLNLISNVSAEYKEIMIKGWASNRQDRPTITQMFEVLDKLHHERDTSEFDTGNIIIDTTFSSGSTSTPPVPSIKIENKLKLLSPGAFSYKKKSNSSSSQISMYSNSSSRSELPSLIPRHTRSSSRSSCNSSISSSEYDGHDYMSHKYFLVETDPSDKFCEDHLDLSDHGDSENLLETFQFRKRSLKNNEIIGDLNLAYEYERDAKYTRAFKIFKQYAELGSADAQFKAGKLLRTDKFKFDLCKARRFAAKYFYEAAKQGHTDAQYEYGTYIIRTPNIFNQSIKIREEALDFIIKASNQKNIKAMKFYSELLSKDGHKYGVKLDLPKADKLKELIEHENIKQHQKCKT